MKTILLFLFSSLAAYAQTNNKNDSVVTKEGFYYKLIFSDSAHYRIRWGNKSQSYISDKKFQFISWGPSFAESSNDAILLTQSCGTSCSVGILLLKNGRLREYDQLRKYDLSNNLIAYIPPETTALIRVENILTQTGITLEGVDVCPAVIKGDCIESCLFTDKGFYIKWQGNKWQKGVPDPREKTIDIRTLKTLSSPINYPSIAERKRLARSIKIGDTVAIAFSRFRTTPDSYVLWLLNYESSFLNRVTNCFIKGRVKQKAKSGGSSILTIEIINTNNCDSASFQYRSMIKGHEFSYNMSYFNLDLIKPSKGKNVDYD